MMREAELTKEIRSGTLAGIYFLFGDEDYLKNRRAGEMRRAVAGGEVSAFNCFEFFFGDGEFDEGAVEDALLSPPILCPQKFVSLTFTSVDSLKKRRGRGAAAGEGSPETSGGAGESAPDPTSDEASGGGSLTGSQNGKKEAGGNRLLDFLRRASGMAGEETVLVIRAVAGGFDAGSPAKNRPSAFLREAEKLAKCVEFPYQTESGLTRWMERHFAEYGLAPAPGVAGRILDAAGRSMYRLSGEVEKTAAYAAARIEREGAPRLVTESDVLAAVSRTDEDEDFGLANAVMQGDTAGALSRLRVKIALREEPLILLGQISRTFMDLYTAASFAADGRDAGDYQRTLGQSPGRAAMYYRAAARTDPSRYAAALRKCLEADRRMKRSLGGSASAYAPLERLICSLGSI